MAWCQVKEGYTIVTLALQAEKRMKTFLSYNLSLFSSIVKEM